MGRIAKLLAAALLAAALTGCVERRFIVESNPPGAVVYQNGQQVGVTPVELPFVYYGTYEFELVKDGFESRKYYTTVRPPWFEWLGIDFFSENIWPRHIQDNRRLRYDLEPLQQPRTEDLLNGANQLRQRGQAIPTPEKPGAPTPPAVVIPPSPSP
ncbi:MAG: PEGA domain-containing protein [Gemmataceae bacterium]